MPGLLTADEINEALLDPEAKDKWIQLFESQQFDQLPDNQGVLIAPFTAANLDPISYDLTVGN